MAPLLRKIKVDKTRLAEAASDEFLMATDLAEYLVKKGTAFRQAHTKVGKLVKYCLDTKKKIKDLSLAELRRFSPYFDKGIYKLINQKISVKNKISYGSTGLVQVRSQLKKWEKKL